MVCLQNVTIPAYHTFNPNSQVNSLRVAFNVNEKVLSIISFSQTTGTVFFEIIFNPALFTLFTELYIKVCYSASETQIVYPLVTPDSFIKYLVFPYFQSTRCKTTIHAAIIRMKQLTVMRFTFRF